MIHSSRRDRKAKAVAEVLVMIADAYPPLAPHRPRPVLETEEWLFEKCRELRCFRRYRGASRRSRSRVQLAERFVVEMPAGIVLAASGEHNDALLRRGPWIGSKEEEIPSAWRRRTAHES
jgi:hypothetical protein